jgi:cephalosporin-C deacetylase-like acetyl esterase
MCGQLDLEVISKRSKKKGVPSNFQEFWSKEVQCKNHPNEKKL